MLETLRGQTVYFFVNRKRIPQQESSVCSSFVLSFPLILPTKKQKTCLMILSEFQRHHNVRLSSAQFGLQIILPRRAPMDSNRL